LHEGVGGDKVSRQTAYLALFKSPMAEGNLEKIRDSINNGYGVMKNLNSKLSCWPIKD
jgi:hypothetical protein